MTRDVTTQSRRQQAERRADTEAKLIDATIQCIIDIGYPRTSVREICQRAGVSHGGLFGRFDTLFDLIAASAVEAGRRLTAQFIAEIAELPDGSDLGAILELLRDCARVPTNAVWIELNVAARTDPALAAQLAVARADYGAAIVAHVVTLPLAAGVPAEALLTVGSIVLQYFDASASTRAAFPTPERDSVQLAAFTTMVRAYLDSVRIE
ncbi:TetR/AcrR family transcriptional regulator [Nocardia sp. CA-128927]|uniref:TetR/AcrR family transcriptional regulator n=1 Tax=Nocardia sp. CA-128927 TaxID=3239975 RepID=UPI003D99DDD2